MDKDAEVVTPGPHAWDGSYTRAEVEWKGHKWRVESAHDGEDLVMLVTPLEIEGLRCRRQWCSAWGLSGIGITGMVTAGKAGLFTGCVYMMAIQVDCTCSGAHRADPTECSD